jgi:hypothetical protein
LDPLFAKLLEKMDAQQVQLERADAKISPIDTTIKL